MIKRHETPHHGGRILRQIRQSQMQLPGSQLMFNWAQCPLHTLHLRQCMGKVITITIHAAQLLLYTHHHRQCMDQLQKKLAKSRKLLHLHLHYPTIWSKTENIRHLPRLRVQVKAETNLQSSRLLHKAETNLQSSRLLHKVQLLHKAPKGKVGGRTRACHKC